jgi:hypothetical protein
LGRAAATAPTRTDARALEATERGRTVRDLWVSLLLEGKTKTHDGGVGIGESRIDVNAPEGRYASRVGGSAVDTRGYPGTGKAAKSEAARRGAPERRSFESPLM